MQRSPDSLDLLKSDTIEDLKRAFVVMLEKNKSEYDFPLVKPPFDFDEVLEAIESLLSTNVTMGQKVSEFESLFAKYIGTEHAIMFNSGSSANLVALSILSNKAIGGHLEKGDSLIVPALTWSTSVFPIVDVGATPVFADSNIDTLTLDVDSVKSCIDERVKGILAVHLIGNPCDMDRLKEICEEHSLFLIEDCCESHGAEFQDKKTGSMSDMGTYSFFFSHHISTIEGGMIVTDNDDYAELARVLRAHGWTRDLKDRKSVEEKHRDRDPRFLFINTGFNLRPTEIQGSFGIHQIQKLDHFVELRRRNASILIDMIEDASLRVKLQREQARGKHSWFGFPIVLDDGGWKTRQQKVAKLEMHGIETRVVMGGNMASQPAGKNYEYKTPVPLQVADYVDQSGILIGLHPQMTEAQCKELGSRVIESLK